MVAENIPAELKAIPQWVTWKYFFRDKWTKPPFNAHTGDLASSNDPATWSDYETAVAAYRNGGFDGIGFVLTRELRFVGIDLDHCIDPRTYAIEAWALEIIDHLNSYTEVSPRGTGLRIFVVGKLPRRRTQTGKHRNLFDRTLFDRNRARAQVLPVPHPRATANRD